jgi:hypothetical protein
MAAGSCPPDGGTTFPAWSRSDIIDGVDALILPDARLEIEALRALRPEPSTWAFLIGHKRGHRIIVERVFPAGRGGRWPNERTLAGLEAIWPGRVVGLLAVRPLAGLKKAVLGPAWYGKLVLLAGGPAKAPVLRPFAVEFDGGFTLAPIPFAPPVKEETHE